MHFFTFYNRKTVSPLRKLRYSVEFTAKLITNTFEKTKESVNVKLSQLNPTTMMRLQNKFHRCSIKIEFSTSKNIHLQFGLTEMRPCDQCHPMIGWGAMGHDEFHIRRRCSPILPDLHIIYKLLKHHAVFNIYLSLLVVSLALFSVT